MSKKAFIAVLSVIVLGLVAIGWYLFSDKKSATESPTDNGTSSTLFPFGQRPVSTGTTAMATSTDDTDQTIDLSGGETLSRLKRISTTPVAGAVAFDMGSTTIIRYVERATGHIVQIANDSTASEQISNVTIPKIQEALWGSDGKNVVLRYLNDDGRTIKTFTGRVSTSTPNKGIEGTYLPDNIQDIAVSGSRIFYIIEGMSGAQGTRANIDGTGRTGIFNSSFGDWAATWASNSVLLFARPSGTAQGSAYLLDMATGALSHTVDRIPGIKGLLNPDETLMIYSGANGNVMGTAIYTIKGAAMRDIGMGTLVDKCVWSKRSKTIVFCAVPKSPAGGVYPDDWYKGKVSFADSVWKIDATTGETTDILDPELEAGISIDMMDLSLDQNESTLLFTNKNDLSLWRLNLE